MREAKANLANRQAEYERAAAERLHDGAGRRRGAGHSRQQAGAWREEQLARAEADLELLQAGAWEPDKAVARADVEQARAQVAADRDRTWSGSSVTSLVEARCCR